MTSEIRNRQLPEQKFSFTHKQKKEGHEEEPPNIKEVKDCFLKKSLAYDELKQELHTIELKILKRNNEDNTKEFVLYKTREDVLKKIKSLKEEFLPLVARVEELLGQSQTIETIKSWIIERAGGIKYLNDWTEFGCKMREVSLDMLYSSTVSMLEEEGPTRTPSPYESILSTIELRKIGRDIAELVKEHTISVCQSGSASWGGYTSTRGQLKPDPLEVSQRELRDMKLISDVDMIMIVESPEDTNKIIEILIKEGRIDQQELARCEKYLELSKKGDVDMFSLRGFHNNVEQSYHILTKKVIDQLTDPHRKPNKTIPSLRDFRPDKPGSFKKYGGYPILGLEGSQIALLKKEPTAADENDGSIGFISESPAGGPIQIDIDGQKQYHYALGLIPTQLMYMPDILHDTDGFFRSQIDQILKSVAPYLPKEEQFSVPRWERMPTQFREKLLRKVYQKTAFGDKNNQKVA